jgi:hypothetical protein
MIDVLQHHGAPRRQAYPQVLSELRVQRRPAEHGSWLLLHQLERGLPRITVKASRRRHERQQERGGIAIFRSQPQPERAPVQIAERQGKSFGQRISRGRLKKVMLPLAASSNVVWAASGSHGNGTSVFASNVMVPPKLCYAEHQPLPSGQFCHNTSVKSPIIFFVYTILDYMRLILLSGTAVTGLIDLTA